MYEIKEEPLDIKDENTHFTIDALSADERHPIEVIYIKDHLDIKTECEYETQSSSEAIEVEEIGMGVIKESLLKCIQANREISDDQNKNASGVNQEANNFHCVKIEMEKKTSTDRVRAFRERKKANKPPRKVPTSTLERSREYRARQRALKKHGGQYNLLTTLNTLDESIPSFSEDTLLLDLTKHQNVPCIMEIEANLPKCTIGNCDDSMCHYSGFHSHKAVLKLVNQFNSEEKELLCRRSGLKFNEGSTICMHHEARLLTNFQLLQTSCYNPFGKKNHAPKKGLRPIDLRTADYLMKLTKKDVKPGQKLCPTCRKEMKNQEEEEASGVPSASSVSDSDDEVVVCGKMNSSLTAIGLSPVKIPRLTSKDSKDYVKKKLNQVQATFAEQIASLSHLKSSDIKAASTSKQCENCSACDELLEGLKQKLKLSSTSRQEKLQILTLVPAKWSIKRTMEEFEVSERMVKKSRKLKMENGLLSMPGKKQGRKLLDEVKQRILCFYEDDEFTRICPGKKDCLSVRTSEGTKVQMQKRLILCNLKELYTAYRVKNESDKVGFSKFCELRPKWCITVGAASVNPFATTSFSSLSVANLHPGQYIACIYDNNWWIGNICEISIEQHDALVNFMHPHGIAHSFYWPSRKDTCWIPEEHILANIPVPKAAQMGRQFSLKEAFMLDIDDKFQSNIK